jgi:hypothetical protein
MKQIFDWLREQIVHTAEDVSPNMDKLLVMYNVERLLNEAEAKWEADCCEWKQYETKYGTRYQNCRATEAPVDTFGFKFCPYCGNPIKISEVE